MSDLKPRISRRALAWIASLLLLFLLAGFFLLPWLARPMLVDALQEKLQRPVAIGALRFNPLTLTANVEDMSVGEKGGGGAQPLLQAKSLYVNLQLRSIWEGAPVIEEIRLEAPRLHLVRNADASYNFDDLIALFSQPSEGPPARFALNNIQLKGGRIEFDDRAVGVRHTVSDLNLALPFLSNLPYATDIFVKPEVAATINGAPFKLSGQSRPFSARHDTALQFSLQQLDLPGYLKYVPVPLGFTLASGKLQANLTVAFQQPPQGGPQVKLSGTAELRDVVAKENDGKPLIAFTRLTADLADADLASQRVQLRSVALEQPQVTLQREKNGKWNFERLAASSTPKQSAAARQTSAAKPAASASAERSNQAANSKPAANSKQAANSKEPSSWQVTAGSIKVSGGKLDFKDLSLSQPFQARFKDIGLTAKDFDSAPGQAFPLDAALQSEAGESFKHSGRMTLQPFKAEGDASLTRLDLKRYAPYYEAQAGMAALQGTLDVSSHYRFEAGSTAQLLLSGLGAKLEALGMRKQGGSADFLRIPGLEIKGGELDLAKRSLSVESLQSRDGKLTLAMSEDGQLRPAASDTLPRGKRGRRLKANAGADQQAARVPAGQQVAAVSQQAAAGRTRVSASSGQKRETPAQSNEPPWQFQLKTLALDGWGVKLQSINQGRGTELAADALRLQASNLSNRKGSSAKLALQGRLGKGGYLRAEGNVALAPLDVDLRLDAKGVEIVPFQPLFSDRLKLTLTDGTVSTRGRLQLASKPDNTLRYAFAGDARVNRLASIDKQNGQDFLKWRSLRVRQISAASEPALKLAIGEVQLADFYTRLVINPDGSFNYQEMLENEKPANGAAQESRQEVKQNGKQNGKPGTQATAGPAAAAGSSANVNARPAQISVGKVVLQGGEVDFRDNFIKPNYSAELTQLAGSISGLSSDPGMLAEVVVKGRVQNQGQLDITGKINPLSGNLYLDLLASLKDFELSPLTPYAAKYAGYGIERGKMSFDVRYKVEDRKLSAENRLVLNRLTFGEKVDSPDAIKAPVLLAVALLQDRNGNINLDLPIAGSLDDPQFSIGGIIVKAIFNLIGRAVTAPFSLIAGLFAESGESSHIAFNSGSSALQPKAQEKLNSLAKALQDRPGLQLDISGRAQAEFDTAGLREAALERKLKVQKLKRLVRDGESVASADEVQISPEEYPRYLAQVYVQENFPGKPRNMFGFVKSLPPEQMRAQLLPRMEVREEDLRALANKRAQDVKDYLVQEGKVASERLFIVAARSPSGEEKLPPGRVDFVLGAR